MLERLCKELGLKYDGRWENVGGYQFTVLNPEMMCYGTSIVVFDTDKLTLVRAMNTTECKWINCAIKTRKEELSNV